MTTPICPGATKTGEQCKMRPRDSGWCIVHDPDPVQSEQRAAARSAGGKARMERVGVEPLRTLGDDTPDVPLETEHDVRWIVRDTISRVRRGELDPRIANAIGQLCNVALSALKQSGVDSKVKAIEEQLRPLKDLGADRLLEIVRIARERRDATSTDA